MKIVSLQAQNIKRISAVHIEPNGNLVEITGKNGQGKTSILDSIWWAICGAENVQTQPIKKGETKAKIVLRLKGDGRELIVTRFFKKQPEGDTTTELVVENAEGARFSKAQSTLNELIGDLSFDPLEFDRGTPREQFETLQMFVPGVDFAGLDLANKEDYARRTQANRFAKDARAAANAITVPEGTPAEPVDVAAIGKALNEAHTTNSGIAQKALEHQARGEQAASLRRRAEERKQRCDALLKEIQTTRDEGVRLELQAEEIELALANAEPLPTVVDIGPLNKQLAEAGEVNRQVERARQKAMHNQTADKYEAESKAITERMEGREKQKSDAVAAAKMPVPGLGFGDGFVTMNDLPFEQASDAERLRVSVSIAMAANPKLRVIRVRDGSLLDPDALKLLGEMCNANDFQCWIETVAGNGKDAFVIEDGHVKAAAEDEK